MNENANQSQGWFKAMRGEAPLELIRANPNAHALAAIIAHRARWHEGFNADGLELSEALLGDHGKCGMTRQQYRSALAFLVKWNFVTIRTTNKGTIARLTDTRLFDPLNLMGNQQDNQKPTTEQPPASQQATTNEEGKKGKTEEIKSDSIKDSLASLKMNPKARRTIDLIELCKSVLGVDEMKRCHKRWRERAETEPDKLWSVLADVRAEKLQREIKNPGAYAEDLWKRFSK